MKALVLLCLTLFIPQQQPASEITVPVVLGPDAENVVIMKRSEAERLLSKEVLAAFTPEYRERLRAALTIALGTAPHSPKCITWEQHVAEVTSWWSAPEREYVPCDDPRVGPPKGDQ